jgi:hypothetical protein
MKFSLTFTLLMASSDAFSPTTFKQSRHSTELGAGVKRNPNFAKLVGGYLFPEIGRRRTQYMEENPEMKDRLISLGIGEYRVLRGCKQHFALVPANLTLPV